MLKRLIVLPLVISLTACSTMSVENHSTTVTATVTKPVLFDSMTNSVTKASKETYEMLKGICDTNQGNGSEVTLQSFGGIATAIVSVKNLAAALDGIIKILPSFSYSATMPCPPHADRLSRIEEKIDRLLGKAAP